MKCKRLIAFIFVLFIFIALSACNNESDVSTDPEDSDDSTNNQNNKLVVAMHATIPTLDPHMSVGSETHYLGRHIFETIVALDENYIAVPHLAESVDVSDDNMTYTFHLREGVKFHNGKEMKAEDVVASLNRWIERASMAYDYLGHVTFEELDEYTVGLELDRPVNGALEILAMEKQFGAIMPKEVIESAEEDGVTEFIGTGPFKFEEWKKSQYVHMKRFEDYSPVDSPPSGLSGKREALVDDLYFEIVTDSSTRLVGLQTGEYDIGIAMSYDDYEDVVNDSNLEPVMFKEGYLNFIYNKKEGIMSDSKMRQAVNAAIDSEEILLASFGSEEIFSLDPGYMGSEMANWYTDVGKEAYNQADPEKAKQLPKEAGYDGEEITIVSTREYEYWYNATIVLKQQLDEAGFNTNLEVYDMSTYQDVREDPGVMDIYITGTTLGATPSSLLPLTTGYPGWTDDDRISDALENILLAESQDDAFEYWEELQEFLWLDYLPSSIVGTYDFFSVKTDKVDGYTVFAGPNLWNTSVSE